MKVIVGAVIFESNFQIQDVQASLYTRLFSNQSNCLYIMTLGVVDQLRSTGLAKRLLEQTILHAQQMPKIEILSLHVVAYNTRAIKFYKKNGFSLLEYMSQHYRIFGKDYDGLKLGLFVNGGRRREKWGAWFKRKVLRMEVVD